MERKRLPEEEIIALLKEAETGLPIQGLVRSHLTIASVG
jgi:hypothetical protein